MGSDSEAEKTAQKVKEKKLLLALAPIAKPLAGKKLSKRIFKLVRRGTFLPFSVSVLGKAVSFLSLSYCVVVGIFR